MTQTADDRMIRRASLVATVNACMFVFGVALLLMGSLLPTLHFSDARAGSLGSFPLIGILIATALVGPVLDKLGAKIALAVALALFASALAMLPSLTSYAGIAMAAFVYGLGAGVLNAATNTLVSGLSADGTQRRAQLAGILLQSGCARGSLADVADERPVFLRDCFICSGDRVRRCTYGCPDPAVPLAGSLQHSAERVAEGSASALWCGSSAFCSSSSLAMKIACLYGPEKLRKICCIPRRNELTWCCSA